MPQMSAKELSKLELLYKRGEKIDEICRKLHVSNSTVNDHARKNGWVHGQSKSEYAKRLAVHSKKRDMDQFVEDADKLNEGYLRKVGQLEGMVNAVLRGLGTTPEEIREVSKQDADRYFTILKSLKISSEIANMHYESSKKALGLDRINDEQGPDLLPLKINVVNRENPAIQAEVEIEEDEDEQTHL